MKRASGFAFAFTFALACAAANASAEANPSALARQINDQGAKAVVNGMSESEWDNVLTHIDSGSTAWIALVPKLAEGADSGNAEDLGIGLAYALPKNPRAVLKAIDPGNGPVLGVNRVCSAPFIEDTVPDIPAYVKRAKAALGKVHDRSLRDVKKACLAELAGCKQRVTARTPNHGEPAPCRPLGARHNQGSRQARGSASKTASLAQQDSAGCKLTRRRRSRSTP